MKKFIGLLVAILFLSLCACASGQDTKSKILSKAQSYYADATDVDLVNTGDTVFYYTFTLNKTQEQLYDYQVNIDSVSGTPNYKVQLYGRLFESDSWSAIGSAVEWLGTGADTTIIISEHSTAVFYRQLQARITGQAGTGAATVDQQDFKVWDE